MDAQEGRYIEIGETSGYDQNFPNRTYTEQLPDIQIGKNPIELQEVTYTAERQGSRKTYSYKSETSLAFKSDAPLLPNYTSTIILNFCLWPQNIWRYRSNLAYAILTKAMSAL